MPLNVAFYSDALTSSGYGLGRYARGLFNALGPFAPDIQTRPVSAHRAGVNREDSATILRDHRYVRLPFPRRMTAGLWSSIGWPRLERWTPWADVVHCVELDYRIPTRQPLVVTIHDIGPLTHPAFFRNSHPWLLKIALKSAVERAAAIICVSSATAEAVETFMKCRLGDRLTVVSEGVGEEFFEWGDQTNGYTRHPGPLPDYAPYFLCAGSLNPRKNLSRVIDAFEQVAREIPHHLVLAGSLGWDSEKTLARIHNSAWTSRIHLPGHVCDEELRRLYRGATAFLYVSLLEGFGLPILEAMASGCPVITSNLSSMPEVAGDAAFLVNPLDTNEIADAMACLATDATFSELLRNKGRARSEDFHWAACAASVAEIYRRVANGPRGKRQRCQTSNGSHPEWERLHASSERKTKELFTQNRLARTAA